MKPTDACKKTCSNCIYWIRPEVEELEHWDLFDVMTIDGMGTCEKVCAGDYGYYDRYNGQDLAWMYVCDTTYNALKTRENFGCNMWDGYADEEKKSNG